MKRSIILIVFAGLTVACGTNSNDNTEKAEIRKYTEQRNPVTILVLQQGSFKNELVNNGKLNSLRKCDLQFNVSEQLERL